MSDDAFPSSQAARRFAPLSEADYARMHDTLTETARGRWFLVEYARRNRNADTAMVLDAVARIERFVATQPPPTASPPSYPGAAIRGMMQRARDDIAADFTGDTGEANTQARRATRIIREIAWQMRECGNDPRICAILDAQLDAIDAALYAPREGRSTALLDAMDRLITEIEGVLSGPSAGPDQAQPDHPNRLTDDYSTEDDAVLARIAAEMATDDDPDADHFDEPALRATPRHAPTAQEKDSLGDMLIARGIIRPAGDRDAPPDRRIN